MIFHIVLLAITSDVAFNVNCKVFELYGIVTLFDFVSMAVCRYYYKETMLLLLVGFYL